MNVVVPAINPHDAEVSDLTVDVETDVEEFTGLEPVAAGQHRSWIKKADSDSSTCSPTEHTTLSPPLDDGHHVKASDGIESGDEADEESCTDSASSVSSHGDDEEGNGEMMVDPWEAELWEQYDAGRMELSDEELEWALAVKKAIESISDLDNLSDLWYAQLALVSQGNIDVAVQQVYRMQDHWQGNDIMDTYDDGIRHLPVEPCWLSIDYNLQTGGYICAIDTTNVDISIFKDPAKTQYYHRRTFYEAQMAFCDLAAVRAGCTILNECEGFELGKAFMLDMKGFQAGWKSLFAYPKNVAQVKFFNNPPIFKMMGALARTALPREMTDAIQYGAKCRLGRLDKLYKLPTPEIAKARLRERMIGLIKKRYANDKFFNLEQQQQQRASAPDPPAGDEIWC